MTPFVLLLFLAVLQGLTEYLPVSSSGHLVLARLLLPGGSEFPEDATLEVVLHLGTLAAVFLFYRKEIWALIQGVLGGGNSPPVQRKLAFYLLLGSLPAAIVGLTLKDSIEATFGTTQVSSLCLLVTGFILWVSKNRGGSRGLLELGASAAILIGLAQSFAILPGISRSGSTIVAALFLGYRIEAAAAFSFLLSIPAILGAAILKLPQALEASVPLPAGIWLATGLAFLVGYFALGLLLRMAQANRLFWFAPYCWSAGLVSFFLS